MKQFMTMVTILFSLITGAGMALAQEANTALPISSASLPHAPLIVPVYPRLDSSKDMPKGADLRDSYIVLEDGSVLSVADWILGSLRKDKAGVGMSDYESRLFLGQVARAAAGMNEDLINRSITNSGPLVPYRQVKKAAPMQVFEGLVRMLILPGTSPAYNPITEGGAFSPIVRQGNTGPLLFERQFSEAMNQHAADFQEAGTMQNMIKNAQNSD